MDPFVFLLTIATPALIALTVWLRWPSRRPDRRTIRAVALCLGWAVALVLGVMALGSPTSVGSHCGPDARDYGFGLTDGCPNLSPTGLMKFGFGALLGLLVTGATLLIGLVFRGMTRRRFALVAVVVALFVYTSVDLPGERLVRPGGASLSSDGRTLTVGFDMSHWANCDGERGNGRFTGSAWRDGDRLMVAVHHRDRLKVRLPFIGESCTLMQANGSVTVALPESALGLEVVDTSTGLTTDRP